MKDVAGTKKNATETENYVTEPLVSATGMCGTTFMSPLVGVCKLVFSSLFVLFLNLRRKGETYPLLEKQKNILRVTALSFRY